MPNASGWQSLSNQTVSLQLIGKHLLLGKQGTWGSNISIPNKQYRSMEVYVINIRDYIIFSSVSRTDVALFQLTYLRGFF